MMDLIDAERQEIFVEKAKLETMERLNTPKSDSLHREKELDAAIRIAQVNCIRILSEWRMGGEHSHIG